MITATQEPADTKKGSSNSSDKLLPLVYAELRRIAQQRLANEKPGQTLQATALVHEVYLRLVGDGKNAQKWNSRSHFFAAASESMRRILVENARRKGQLKRGGNFERVDLDTNSLDTSNVNEDLVELDAALTKLAVTDPLSAELIQLRYFGGFTFAEAAEALGISQRTAERTWEYARAWLRCEMHVTDAIKKSS